MWANNSQQIRNHRPFWESSPVLLNKERLLLGTKDSYRKGCCRPGAVPVEDSRNPGIVQESRTSRPAFTGTAREVEGLIFQGPRYPRFQHSNPPQGYLRLPAMAKLRGFVHYLGTGRGAVGVEPPESLVRQRASDLNFRRIDP